MTPKPTESDAEACALLCEQLAKIEAKKANENRGKRKTWLIRRRALLDAATAIRASNLKGSVPMSRPTLSQGLAAYLWHLYDRSNPEVMDAIKRLEGTSTPVPQDPPPTDPQQPNEPPDDDNNPPEPPDHEDPNEPDEPEVPTDPVPPPSTSGKAPGELFDLTRWKLNLPVQLNGAKTGYSPTVNIGKSPDLKTFKMKDIWEGTANGQVLVTCPIDGITTSGSTKYARTELRGTWPPGEPNQRDTPYNFDFLPSKGEHRIECEFAVLQFAKLESNGKEGRVCIGQIHGPDDELCRFYLDPSMDSHPAVFYYVNDKSTNGGKPTGEQIIALKDTAGQVCKDYTKGEWVKRTIEVRNQVLTVMAIYRGKTYTFAEPLSSFWKGSNAWCYFKDGVYVAQHQRAVDGGVRGSGTVKVLFRNIGVVSHQNGTYRTA